MNPHVCVSSAATDTRQPRVHDYINPHHTSHSLTSKTFPVGVPCCMSQTCCTQVYTHHRQSEGIPRPSDAQSPVPTPECAAASRPSRTPSGTLARGAQMPIRSCTHTSPALTHISERSCTFDWHARAIISPPPTSLTSCPERSTAHPCGDLLDRFVGPRRQALEGATGEPIH